jgi:plastocyanin
MQTPHLCTIYEPTGRRAKWLPVAALFALLVTTGAARAQSVHVVRLEVESDQEIYRFVPARVTVRPGDVLRFKVSSGAPHNIAFDGERLTTTARAALNAAMSNRTGDLSGPVLERTGAEYRIVVPTLAPGRYGFYCTPHRAYDMRGELIVVK